MCEISSVIVGILQLELDIPGAASLKDKRRVVKSLKDRLHREHLVSIGEIAKQDALTSAVLGVACVGSEQRRIAQTLDMCVHKARQRTDCEVVSTARRIAGIESLLDTEGTLDEASLAEEMLARASEHAENSP